MSRSLNSLFTNNTWFHLGQMMKSAKIIIFIFWVIPCHLFAIEKTQHPEIKPNILWLVCEDASIEWFGCYGNKEAKTPHIDELARQGFRYTNTYASAPVCAAQRSTWITGLNSISTGTQPMRSRYNLPHDLISYYPDELQKAGYYTANHSKTDYNIGNRKDDVCWNSNTASAWEERKPGQPFFQVINFGSSHESRAQGDVSKTDHSPQNVTLHAYHPDDPLIRANYAKYYDACEKMDDDVGATLKRLETAGLDKDTIVIFCSDHGGVMPRSKRFLYQSGIHCPLIIRIPEKFKTLWPLPQPGGSIDDLVSFVDFPKTWLSLAGAPIQPLMQGRIFLGAKQEPQADYVYSFRERMDERFDNQRSVRNKRFVYIKNYMPDVPLGQRLSYLWKMSATRAWEEAWIHHRTNDVTGKFFMTKPLEELYDYVADPDNVVDLASKSEYQQTLATLRAKLCDWQIKICDSGLLPEGERLRRAEENHTTIYEMVRNPKLYNLPVYLDAADLALNAKPESQPQFIGFLKSQDSGLRYWGAMGLLRSKINPPAVEALRAVLQDPCGEVAAIAAWALQKSGNPSGIETALNQLLKRDATTLLFVLNALDWMKVDLAPYQKSISEIKNPPPPENASAPQKKSDRTSTGRGRKSNSEEEGGDRMPSYVQEMIQDLKAIANQKK